MKKLLIFLFAISFFSCKKDYQDCCAMPPLGSELNGTWKFVKLTYGFSQISVSGDKLPFQETLNFDFSTSTFQKTQNGKLIETSKFLIEQNSANRLIIKYLADNTYQFFSVETKDGKTILDLYQRTEIGSQLADGSDYFYEKQ